MVDRIDFVELTFHHSSFIVHHFKMTVFENLQQIIKDIEAAQPADAAALEQFRIKYLGSKNIIKPLSKGFREVPNEQKKEFGQLLNKAKQAAEQKFQGLKDSFETVADEAAGEDLDLTAPAEAIALGSRPVSYTHLTLPTIRLV